jgi:hypothetical protein
MSTRKFFTIATLSILLAFPFHFLALHYVVWSERLFWELTQRPANAESQRILIECASVLRHMKLALWSGVALAALSVIFTLLSYRADESAPRSIVIVLLLLFGLLHFVAMSVRSIAL